MRITLNREQASQHDVARHKGHKVESIEIIIKSITVALIFVVAYLCAYWF